MTLYNKLGKLFSKKQEVVEVKAEPDIKEPVYSFIKCFKKNPKRFKIEVDVLDDVYQIKPLHSLRTDYTLTDKETGKEFSVRHIVYSQRWWSTNFYNYPDFLTNDEINYIYNEINSYFTCRKNKFDSLKQTRRQRAANKQRQELMKDYCGDVK